jgi:hypothetical protein
MPRIEFCEGCGAPLEARWSEIVIECRYCGAHSAPGAAGEPVPSSIPDDGRPRLAIGGRTYLLLGFLARGDSTNVHLARWVRRLGELVVLKILHSSEDADLMRREHAFLERLHASPVPGAGLMTERVPEPVALGPVKFGGHERLVAVHRWRSGFLHTLQEIKEEHPKGVDPRVAVWIFKRLLEVLHFCHRSGVVHGAVLPPHVLVHPRDHGAMLVGWSTAQSWSPGDRSERIATSRRWRSWYPEARTVAPEDDIAMTARCVLWVAGADSPRLGGRLPDGLTELATAAANGTHDNALDLVELIAQRSLEELGPPVYCPLEMPGWTT